MAYDELQGRIPHRADKEYVRILHLAACESETGVDSARHHLLGHDEAITLESVKALVASETQRPSLPESVSIDVVDLAAYDDLLVAAEVV
jgi:hypothetical protein